MDIYKVIREPHITEKGTLAKEMSNQVCFRVDRRANKVEIRHAVESIWKVKVDKVRTQRYQGKTKRLGRFVGQRPAWKKAIVTLAEGQSIPDFS